MTITPKEWRWAIAWAIAMLTLSCIPYLIAIWNAPAGWQFAGILVNPYDGQSYLAKMQQGFMGNWRFHLAFTPEPHDGSFIFTFYLALGHLARLTGLPKIIVFHLARILAGFGLLLMAYRFIARIISDTSTRKLAFVLMLTASGVGWLGAAFGAFPIDLWVPEAFVPYSIYANPHFPLGMMLMLIIFDQVIIMDNGKWVMESSARSLLPTPHSLLLTAASAFALAIVLPFGLLTVWAVIGVFGVWLIIRRRRLPWSLIWLTLLTLIVSMPIILYQYWVSTTNPILAGWNAQNITPAPEIVDFLLGYGLVGILAVVGAIFVIRQQSVEPHNSVWLTLFWAAATIVLVYIPFNLQRRLITGLHLPLCILAAVGLKRWLATRRLKPASQRLMITGLVTLGALGTLLVWSFPLLGMRESPDESATTALFFMRNSEVAAFDWLQRNSAPNDVVLASPRVGLFVPGQTGARSFYGHPFETIDADHKKAQVESFYRDNSEAVVSTADYIFYGPSEQRLGQPKILATLPVVYSAQDITIYQTR